MVPPYRALLLALPFVAVASWARWYVAPRWGDAIAHALGDVAEAVGSREPASPAASVGAGGPLDGEDVAALLEGLDAGDAPGPSGDAGPRANGAGMGGAPSKGARDAGSASTAGGGPPGSAASVVHVPAWAVEKAIEDGGKNVRGRTFRDASGHAVGVKLTGVSAAHVGLEDGDLVTAINGVPTPTDDDATEVALSAIGRGDPSLRATVVRGARVIEVVLDLPGPAGSSRESREPRDGREPRKKAR